MKAKSNNGLQKAPPIPKRGTYVSPNMSDAGISAARGGGLSDAKANHAIKLGLERGARPFGLSKNQQTAVDRGVSAAKHAEPK